MAPHATRQRPAIGRTDQQVCALMRTAFVHVVNSSGASVRSLARWMRIAPSTVTRWLDGSTPVNPAKVLRSRKLDAQFVLCVAALIRRNHRG